ncbi:MAG: hypothetical protein SGPRY_003632 [Prymnesium sp.]
MASVYILPSLDSPLLSTRRTGSVSPTMPRVCVSLPLIFGLHATLSSAMTSPPADPPFPFMPPIFPPPSPVPPVPPPPQPPAGCPAGSVRNGQNCTLCGMGTFMPLTDHSESLCFNCPSRTYMPVEGAAECRNCSVPFCAKELTYCDPMHGEAQQYIYFSKEEANARICEDADPYDACDLPQFCRNDSAQCRLSPDNRYTMLAKFSNVIRATLFVLVPSRFHILSMVPMNSSLRRVAVSAAATFYEASPAKGTRCGETAVKPQYRYFFIACKTNGTAECTDFKINCPSAVSEDIWWTGLADTLYDSNFTSDTSVIGTFETNVSDPRYQYLDGRTIHVLVNIYEGVNSTKKFGYQLKSYICLSRTKVELLIDLASMDETSSPIDFTGVHLLRTSMWPTDADSKECSLIPQASASGNGTSDAPYALSDREHNWILELGSGHPGWAEATDDFPEWAPSHHTEARPEWPQRSVEGWLGASGWNALLDVESQGEQPMATCRGGTYKYQISFNLSDAQLACGALSMEVVAPPAVPPPVQDHEIMVERLTGSPMIAGTNYLRVVLEGISEDSPCGVHVQARVSRFDFHHSSPRLANDATDNTLDFPRLPAGSVVIALMGSTNRAGLSSVTSSNLITIDDTPPVHPTVQGCTPGGFFSPLDPDSFFYQGSTWGLSLCWQPQTSFLDPESELWTLEWQLARWVADNSTWDTLIPTQTLAPTWGQEIAKMGMLNLTNEALQSISTFASLEHPHRYRLGLRAVNRAGVVSCGPALESCRERERLHGANSSGCVCPDPTGRIDNWAATQYSASTPFMIDLVPPSCAFASAWLCDPGASTPFASPGTPQDGQQADDKRLHVQWQGFTDLDSGIHQCEVIVLRTRQPGVIGAGSACRCSAVMPSPACDCAPFSNGEPTQCALMTDYLRKFSSYTWLTSPDPMESQMGRLIQQQITAQRVCIPAQPFNLGDRKLSSGCDFDWECAPLTAGALERLPAGSDERVYCYDRKRVSWAGQHFWREHLDFSAEPERFHRGICLPSSLVTSGSLPNSPHDIFDPTGDNEEPCTAIEVEAVVATPDRKGIPWRGGAPVFGHIAYRIDELPSEPLACPVDCVNQISYFASRHDGQCQCPSRMHTKYAGGSLYRHSFCLTPGQHTLALEDMSGFGWFGANVALLDKTGDPIALTDLSGMEVTSATINSPTTCDMPCPSTNDAEATCWARLFDPAEPLCADLINEGCECHACCIPTSSSLHKWRAAKPDAPQKAWDGLGNGTSTASNRFVFEIFPPMEFAPALNTSVPPVFTEVKKVAVPCTGGRSSAIISGLQLEHLKGYVASVRAIDRAGNAAACGRPQYGRLTTDGIGQRAVIIDATPPEANRTKGAVLDVASLFQPALPLPPDTDHFHSMLAHIGCDWSSLEFRDPHSRLTGFEWALSADGQTDVIIPWTDVGIDTFGAATMSSLESCDLRALRPPPSPPTPPDVPPAPSVFSFSPHPPPGVPPLPPTTSPPQSPPLTPPASVCLQTNVRYHCLVRAYNAAGGYTTVSSDGFVLDETPPVGGYVVDGPDPEVDQLVSSLEFELSASWGAFVDEEYGQEGLSYLVGFDECSKPVEELIGNVSPFAYVGHCAANFMSATVAAAITTVNAAATEFSLSTPFPSFPLVSSITTSKTTISETTIRLRLARDYTTGCTGGSDCWSFTDTLRSGDIVAISADCDRGGSHDRVADCAWLGGACTVQPFPVPAGHWGSPKRVCKSAACDDGEILYNGDLVFFQKMSYNSETASVYWSDDCIWPSPDLHQLEPSRVF